MRPILPALLVALMIAATFPSQALAQQVLMDVEDPVGDDKGPGYYGYPSNPVFVEGAFDITKFRLIDSGDRLLFSVSVADLGGNPWGGPNGFSLQNIQIYVRTTQTGLPSRTDTLGLNVVFAPSFAWHFAIVIVPGWEESIVPFGQRAGIFFYESSIVQDGVLEIIVEDNTITASVSKEVLPDVENAANWQVVVALASYDGFGPNRVRPAGPTGGEWVINATATADREQTVRISKAIAAGIEPRVLDLLVAPGGLSEEDQYNWLDSYNPDLGLMAMIPPIDLEPEVITETVTEISTVTTTRTVTQTEVETETITETTTQVTTSVSTTTETKTVTETNWAVSIVLLIVGLAVGFMASRMVS